MPTKSKSTISASESEDTLALAAAKASSEAFADAQALTIDRQTDHDNAEMAEAEMESQFSQGDASATGLDYATALAETLRTEMLSNAAQAAEKRAESAVVNTSVTLAEIALPWVQEALKGVDCRTSFYTPKTSPDKPVAYVIQRTPTEDLGKGSVAGKIEVRYYRPDLYRAIDAGDIQAAAERAHCRVVAAFSGRHFADVPAETFTQTYGADMKVDTVQIKIERGQSPVPLIPTPPTDTIASSNVSHTFGADLAAACRTTTDGPVRGVDREYVGAAVVVKPTGGKITSMEVSEEGVRTTTVKIDLTYRREGDTRRNIHMDRHLRELCADWEGSFECGHLIWPHFDRLSS